MGFESLLGNERLKSNLRQSINQGHISHFYLISGPEGSGKHTLARLLAAAILCQGKDKPCLMCPACRKVREGLHPDFITVDDPDKKTVSVDRIRQARADVFVRPNEAEHKIYLFPRAQDMGLPGQNALLKVLEEPPAYGVFLLLTDNPAKLLPTIRSRCVELSMQPLPEDTLRSMLRSEFPQAQEEVIFTAIERSGGFLGQAKTLLAENSSISPQTEGFARAYAARDTMALMQVLVPMEKWKRDQLRPELERWLSLLENALAYRAGLHAASAAAAISAGRSSAELMRAVLMLKKTIDYIQGNVSPAAICGYLEWTLR